MKIISYTDGASLGNPGPGGYGVVLMSEELNLRKELSAGYRLTTNNRMELLAVIVALESLRHPGTQILIHSDSSYVVNAIEKGWLKAWVKKGFKDKKNPDLWQRYLKAAAPHKVKLKWVKGHAGIPENERADQLASAAAAAKPTTPDAGYEQQR